MNFKSSFASNVFIMLNTFLSLKSRFLGYEANDTMKLTSFRKRQNFGCRPNKIKLISF